MGKRILDYWDILLIAAAALILAAAVILEDWAGMIYLRVVLGIPLVLFCPGYVLTAALYPKKSDLEVLPRVFLSLGLSITAVPLLGLVLCYTDWGLRLIPALITLTVFILALSLAAACRRSSLPREERFIESLWLQRTAWCSRLRSRPLAVILLLAITGSAGVGLYTIMTPRNYEPFTEFYVLGVYGKAADYPRQLRVDEEGRVLVGITNHEHRVLNYYLEVRIDGDKISNIGPISLQHDQGWEELVNFSASEPQEKVKVEFLLFKEGEPAPYHSLHLWLSILPRQQ